MDHEILSLFLYYTIGDFKASNFENRNQEMAVAPLVSRESEIYGTAVTTETYRRHEETTALYVSSGCQKQEMGHPGTDFYFNNGNMKEVAPLVSHESNNQETAEPHNFYMNIPNTEVAASSQVFHEGSVPVRSSTEDHHFDRENLRKKIAPLISNDREIQQKCRHKITGFGKFKVEVASLLMSKLILDLATLFEYPNDLRDRLVNAKDGLGSHLMVSAMENRGQISSTDISPLVEALNLLQLKGIAGRVKKSFFENLAIGEEVAHDIKFKQHKSSREHMRSSSNRHGSSVSSGDDLSSFAYYECSEEISLAEVCTNDGISQTRADTVAREPAVSQESQQSNMEHMDNDAKRTAMVNELYMMYGDDFGGEQSVFAETSKGELANPFETNSKVDHFSANLKTMENTLNSFIRGAEDDIRLRTKKSVDEIGKEAEQMKVYIDKIANARKELIAEEEEQLLLDFDGRKHIFHRKTKRVLNILQERLEGPIVGEDGYTQLIQYQKLAHERERLEQNLTEIQNIIQCLTNAYAPKAHLENRMVKVSEAIVQRLQEDHNYLVTAMTGLSVDRLLLISCNQYSARVVFDLLDVTGTSINIKRYEDESARKSSPVHAAAVNEDKAVVGWTNKLFILTNAESTCDTCNLVDIGQLLSWGATISCLAVDKQKEQIAVGNDTNNTIHIFDTNFKRVTTVSLTDVVGSPPVSLALWNSHLLVCDGEKSALLADKNGTIVDTFPPPENGSAPVAVDIHNDTAYLLWHNGRNQTAKIQRYLLTNSTVTVVGQPVPLPDDTKFITVMPSLFNCTLLVTGTQRGHITVYCALDTPEWSSLKTNGSVTGSPQY